MLHLIGACVLVVLSSPPPPRTWVVDVNNGAGADFTSLPPAIAAAADGDAIVVRDGVYCGSPLRVVAKSLRIVAAAGARPLICGPNEVSNLTPAQSVVIRGLELHATSNLYTSLRIADCAGRVHLDEVTISASDPTSQNPAIDARGVALLSISRSSIRPTLLAIDSRLQISGSSLRGADASVVDLTTGPAFPALQLQRSKATLALTRARGGDGLAHFLAHLQQAPAAGIVLARSEVTVVGDASTVIATGSDPHPTRVPVSAIDGRADGETIISTYVVLSPINGAPGIAGWFAYCPLPALDVGIDSVGDTLRGQLVSPAGDLLVLLGGAPTTAIATPFGDLLVDRPLILATHVQGPDERFTFDVRVPRLPTLERQPVALQAAVISVGGHVGLTNAVVTTVFP